MWLFETLFYSCNSAKRAQKSHAKTTKSPQHCLICTLVSRDKISVTLLNPQKPTLKRLYLAALSANSNKKRIIWWFQKTFFRAENREKSASAVFSGLSRRVDCTIKIQNFEKFFVYTVIVQSFFQKPLFARRFCSSWATGMFDTSNCSKFSLVGQLKFWPEVDFPFFYFKREVVLNTFFYSANW